MIHHPEPIYDRVWQGTELAADATHRYLWLWQGYNTRLIALPLGEAGGWGYSFGWCYPRDPDLIVKAVRAWDPETEDEPMGWHKRACGLRRAPRREEKPEYNLPRCVHGDYVETGCRTFNCPGVREGQAWTMKS